MSSQALNLSSDVTAFRSFKDFSENPVVQSFNRVNDAICSVVQSFKRFSERPGTLVNVYRVVQSFTPLRGQSSFERPPSMAWWAPRCERRELSSETGELSE